MSKNARSTEVKKAKKEFKKIETNRQETFKSLNALAGAPRKVGRFNTKGITVT